MRVAVLPRAIADRVITNGIARGAWAVNAASLALSIPLVAEYLAARQLAAALPVPVAILAVLLVLAVAGAFLPRPSFVAGFLLVGAVGTVLYELSLLAAHPGIVDDGFFILNRPAVSLVLVGVAAGGAVVGLSWTFVGFLISTGASFAVAGITGSAVMTGSGPALMLALYVCAYLALAAIQARLRRLVPDFEQLELEMGRLTVEEQLRNRMTATIHDTLLGDLAFVMNSPEVLDARAVARLRRDVATLTAPEWLTAAADVAVLDDQDSELRNRIMLVISELQWRGLTVRVTGADSAIYRLDPEVATALVDAARASLENVLRHAGTGVAELDLAYTPQEVTLMISDDGAGFDPAAVAADRLGLRESIEGRIVSVGGRVRIWSSPGNGTSVVIAVPVLEMVVSSREPERGA